MHVCDNHNRNSQYWDHLRRESAYVVQKPKFEQQQCFINQDYWVIERNKSESELCHHINFSYWTLRSVNAPNSSSTSVHILCFNNKTNHQDDNKKIPRASQTWRWMCVGVGCCVVSMRSKMFLQIKLSIISVGRRLFLSTEMSWKFFFAEVFFKWQNLLVDVQ